VTGATQVRAIRFVLGSLILLILASLFIVLPFIAGTLFAIILGYLLQGPYLWLRERLKSPALSAAIVVTGVVIAILAPLVLIIWQLVLEVTAFVEAAGQGGYEAAVANVLVNLGVSPDAAGDVFQQMRALATQLVRDHALTTLGQLAGFFANVGVFLFLLFFILVWGENLGRLAGRAIPLPQQRRDQLLSDIGGRVRALFLGTFLVAIIQGAVATLGWWILGFPSPLLWGLVMTIVAVIPAVGPAIIMVPAGILAIVQGQTWAGGALIVYGLVVVSLLDNIVRPYIVGRSSDVHAALVLLGTLGGLSVLGVTGFVLGPLILSMVRPLFDTWEALRTETKA
jgi:predicted PurR-regulated permease PerM